MEGRLLRSFGSAISFCYRSIVLDTTYATRCFGSRVPPEPARANAAAEAQSYQSPKFKNKSEFRLRKGTKIPSLHCDPTPFCLIPF
jgi:hypothetical protein